MHVGNTSSERSAASVSRGCITAVFFRKVCGWVVVMVVVVVVGGGGKGGGSERELRWDAQDAVLV